MNTSTYEHNVHLITNEHRSVVKLMLARLQAQPVHQWPEKSKKAQEPGYKNASKLKSFCVLQSVQNVHIAQDFLEDGFSAEVAYSPVANRLFDFVFKLQDEATHLVVECEFGNQARADSDYLKFGNAFHKGFSTCGVLICPMASLGRITTGGGVTYEQAVASLKDMHPEFFRSPVIVIGLHAAGAEVVNWKTSKIPHAEMLSGNSDKALIRYAVGELRAGTAVADIAVPAKAILRLPRYAEPKPRRHYQRAKQVNTPLKKLPA